jgi:hypothetical protein
MESQFNVVLSVSPRTGPQAGSVAEPMYDRRSIEPGRMVAADGDVLRIEMVQYLVHNGWCDVGWCLRLLLARSLSTGIHSWIDPADVKDAEAQPPKYLV